MCIVAMISQRINEMKTMRSTESEEEKENIASLRIKEKVQNNCLGN